MTPFSISFFWTFETVRTFYYTSLTSGRRGILRLVLPTNSSYNDQCPNNPNKTIEGKCGCEEPESTADRNLNGILDCLEFPSSGRCAFGSLKSLTVPGECGCDKYDVDTDKDMVPDCIDLCVNSTRFGGFGCTSIDKTDLPLLNVNVREGAVLGAVKSLLKLVRVDEAGSVVNEDHVVRFDVDASKMLKVQFVYAVNTTDQVKYLATAKAIEILFRYKIENIDGPFGIAWKVLSKIDNSWITIERTAEAVGNWKFKSLFIERNPLTGFADFITSNSVRIQLTKTPFNVGSGTVVFDFSSMRFVG